MNLHTAGSRWEGRGAARRVGAELNAVLLRLLLAAEMSRKHPRFLARRTDFSFVAKFMEKKNQVGSSPFPGLGMVLKNPLHPCGWRLEKQDCGFS